MSLEYLMVLEVKKVLNTDEPANKETRVGARPKVLEPN